MRKFRHLQQKVLAPATEEMSQLIRLNGERDPDAIMRRWMATVSADEAMTRECVRKVGDHIMSDMLTAAMQPPKAGTPRLPARAARAGLSDILAMRAKDAYDEMVTYLTEADTRSQNAEKYRPIVDLIDKASPDWKAYERKVFRTLCRDLHIPEQMTLALVATGTDG